jgi:hypothetical protein
MPNFGMNGDARHPTALRPSAPPPPFHLLFSFVVTWEKRGKMLSRKGRENELAKKLVV